MKNIYLLKHNMKNDIDGYVRLGMYFRYVNIFVDGMY